ncbi:hypothetical protein ACLQ2Q_11490 [Microbacterium sp. DT81.1]|uniref:hypothetical protein n=1 Tax=Microbacterium sp. DT81.1 TaxID=3393413 RepID=UPI003CE6BD38
MLIGSGDVHLVGHRVYLEVIPFGGQTNLPPPPPWLLAVLTRAFHGCGDETPARSQAV